MKNIFTEVRGGVVLTAGVAVLLLTAVLLYGPTEVGFRDEFIAGKRIVYRRIKNGIIGSHCYDQAREKVIAPSRWFGPEWVPIASVNAETTEYSDSITCKPYHVFGKFSEPVSARYPE